METLSESVDSVVSPQAGESRVQTPPFPPVLQGVRKSFSEIIHSQRGDDFIGRQLFNKFFWMRETKTNNNTGEWV